MGHRQFLLLANTIAACAWARGCATCATDALTDALPAHLLMRRRTVPVGRSRNWSVMIGTSAATWAHRRPWEPTSGSNGDKGAGRLRGVAAAQPTGRRPD